MAAQRRQVLDTGFGANAATGVLEALTGHLQAKQAQKEKLAQIFATALAEQQAKAAYPSPEDQAWTQVLGMADQAGQVPQPMGGYNPQEQAAGIPGQVTDAAQQRKLQFLQYLLPRGTASSGVNVYAFNPATGKVEPAEGGAKLPPGSRVLPTRTTPEEAAALSQGRAEGTAAGTPLSPQASSLVQNFAELDKAMEKIDTQLASDTGFKDELFRTGLPFQPWAGDLADELLNASDILLRMRSGAQINEKEFGRLRGLLPRSRTALSELLGNPGRARNQVARFKEAAKEILDSKRTKSDFRGTTESNGIGRFVVEAE